MSYDNSLHPEQESDDHSHSLQFLSKPLRTQLNLDGKRLPGKKIFASLTFSY